MPNNFFEYIHTTLLQYPNQELIIWPESFSAGSFQSYTGSTLLGRISAIRRALNQLNADNGSKILVAVPVGPSLVCTVLAIMGQGYVPVLPPAAASLFNLAQIIRREKIKGVITQTKPGFIFSLGAATFGVRLIHIDKIPHHSIECLPPQNVQPHQAGLITHSSGSTGKAKSIYRSHQVLQAQHLALKEVFPPWPGQRDYPLFPNVLLHNLAAGTVSILPDIPRLNVTHMAPGDIVRQMSNQRVQTLTGNVYYFTRLLQYLQQHPRALIHVRAVGIGGSPVPETLAHALRSCFPRADVYIIYGSSEAEPIAVRKVSSEPLNPRLGYGVGTFHPGIRWRITFGEQITIPNQVTYQSGEIEVSGSHVATAGNALWFRTGDYGYVDAHNQLFLTGRKGNERIHQGVQHYQIEHVLVHVAGVGNVAARSLKNGFNVYVTGKAKAAAIRQALEEHFPAGIIQHVYFRDDLPVDSRHHSKIKYEHLK